MNPDDTMCGRWVDSIDQNSDTVANDDFMEQFSKKIYDDNI